MSLACRTWHSGLHLLDTGFANLAAFVLGEPPRLLNLSPLLRRLGQEHL